MSINMALNRDRSPGWLNRPGGSSSGELPSPWPIWCSSSSLRRTRSGDIDAVPNGLPFSAPDRRPAGLGERHSFQESLRRSGHGRDQPQVVDNQAARLWRPDCRWNCSASFVERPGTAMNRLPVVAQKRQTRRVVRHRRHAAGQRGAAGGPQRSHRAAPGRQLVKP